MTSVKQEIISFADSNPGFALCDILQHMKKKNKKSDALKVCRALEDLCRDGKLVSTIEPLGHMRVRRYRRLST